MTTSCLIVYNRFDWMFFPHQLSLTALSGVMHVHWKHGDVNVSQTFVLFYFRSLRSVVEHAIQCDLNTLSPFNKTYSGLY